jgi:hypothetical protein
MRGRLLMKAESLRTLKALHVYTGCEAMAVVAVSAVVRRRSEPVAVGVAVR